MSKKPMLDKVSAPRMSSRMSKRNGSNLTVYVGRYARMFVNAHRNELRLIIDLDAIAGTMTCTTDPLGRLVALCATHAAMRRAADLREQIQVAVIHANAIPEQINKYREAGYLVIAPNYLGNHPSPAGKGARHVG